MLIYEKNNKLNINFDNEVSENPDLQIGKDGDKTEVLVDGKQSGGSSAPLICTDTEGTLDKTFTEIYTAFMAGTPVIVQMGSTSKPVEPYKCLVINVSESAYKLTACCETHLVKFYADSENGYPTFQP